MRWLGTIGNGSNESGLGRSIDFIGQAIPFVTGSSRPVGFVYDRMYEALLDDDSGDEISPTVMRDSPMSPEF